MSSTFGRATLGFMILTAALCAMALVALWALGTYAPGGTWGPLIVVGLSLAAEIGIYSSTLHDPIADWIAEPRREKERQERLADLAAREKEGRV